MARALGLSSGTRRPDGADRRLPRRQVGADHPGQLRASRRRRAPSSPIGCSPSPAEASSSQRAAKRSTSRASDWSVGPCFHPTVTAHPQWRCSSTGRPPIGPVLRSDAVLPADRLGVVHEARRHPAGHRVGRGARHGPHRPELLAGLDERFTLLSSVRRGQRHRTLEATLDWSYDLLDGGATADPAGARRVRGRVRRRCGVRRCASVSRVVALDVLETLVAKSMVVRAGSRTVGPVRPVGDGEGLRRAAARRDRRGGRGPLTVTSAHLPRVATPYGRTVVGEIRLAVRLRPESRNLTAAFEWAAKTDRWTLAGEIMVGADSPMKRAPPPRHERSSSGRSRSSSPTRSSSPICARLCCSSSPGSTTGRPTLPQRGSCSGRRPRQRGPSAFSRSPRRPRPWTGRGLSDSWPML